jgi:hypothetical protein
MASRKGSSKAYTIDYMPTCFSDADMLAHFQKCVKGDSEQAKNLLAYQKSMAKRGDDRALIRYDEDLGAYRGRMTQKGSAMFGGKTEGGKDNLRNFLIDFLGNQYLTTPELLSVLESRYGRAAESKYKQARKPEKQNLQWHRSVNRWSLFGKPTPTLAEFKADLDAGKRGERLRLYGLMPRLLRKTGEQYSVETDQVLQFMIGRAGSRQTSRRAEPISAS